MTSMESLLDRFHGNTQHAPKHTATMEDTRGAVTFIINMAAVHGLPLPGRNRTNKDERYLLLPSDMTKAFVYRKYSEQKCTLCGIPGHNKRSCPSK